MYIVSKASSKKPGLSVADIFFEDLNFARSEAERLTLVLGEDCLVYEASFKPLFTYHITSSVTERRF